MKQEPPRHHGQSKPHSNVLGKYMNQSSVYHVWARAESMAKVCRVHSFISSSTFATLAGRKQCLPTTPTIRARPSGKRTKQVCADLQQLGDSSQHISGKKTRELFVAPDTALSTAQNAAVYGVTTDEARSLAGVYARHTLERAQTNSLRSVLLPTPTRYPQSFASSFLRAEVRGHAEQSDTCVSRSPKTRLSRSPELTFKTLDSNPCPITNQLQGAGFRRELVPAGSRQGHRRSPPSLYPPPPSAHPPPHPSPVQHPLRQEATPDASSETQQKQHIAVSELILIDRSIQSRREASDESQLPHKHSHHPTLSSLGGLAFYDKLS